MQNLKDASSLGIGLTVGATVTAAAAAAYYVASRPEPIKPPVDLNNQAIELEDGSRISRLNPEPFEYYYNDVKTTYEGFRRGVSVSNDGPCLGVRPKGSKTYVWQSYQQVFDRAQSLGSGFIADGLQPKNDTFIGIYSMNRPEWVITDIACASFSMVSVPLYDTLGPDACTFIINNVKISHVVCDKEDKVKTLVASANKTPSLKCIVVMETVTQETKDLAQQNNIRIKQFSEVEQSGKAKLQDPVPPKPSDLMTICFTSGTTGDPKGVMITHKNIICNMSAIIYTVKTYSDIKPSDRHLSYLPLAHNFERGMQVIMQMCGCQIGFSCGDIRKLPEDLQCLQPSYFPTVPRLLNRIYDKVLSSVQASSFASWLFDIALSKKMNELNRFIIRNNSIWDYLVFRKIQKQLGGKVKIILTGSAPLEAKVMNFSRCAFGCLVLEGYGQTEAFAGVTFSLPGDTSLNHVGAPLAGVTVKVDDVPEMGYYAKDGKGEVCCKGPGVFSGYYNNKEKTAEALDKDGWLHTGDIGVWLPNGTLRIIDRKKNIFKLAQGEYIAPEKIEITYMRSKYVAQMYVDGNSLKPFLLGVAVPDEETIMKLAKEVGVSEDMKSVCQSQKIKEEILKDITSVGKSMGLKSFEQESVTERDRSQLPITEQHSNLETLKKHLISFLGINERAKKLGFQTFDLKIHRIDRSSGKIENFSITTQQQWDIERVMLSNHGELNIHVVRKQVKWSQVLTPGSVQKKDKIESSTIKPQKRKRKTEALKDKNLIKRLKDGDQVKRDDRQESELSLLRDEMKKLSNTVTINEIEARCGLCNISITLPTDRKPQGRINYFKKVHYDKCLEKTKKTKLDIDSNRKLTSFFAVKKDVDDECKISDDIDNVCDDEEVDRICDEIDEFFDDDETIESKQTDDSLTVRPSANDIADIVTDSEYADTSSCTSDDDDLCFSNVVFEDPHPLAKRIQDSISAGKLEPDSFIFKYLNDISAFSLKSDNEQFQWNQEVLEFFNTVKYLGGQKTYNFVRGPGFIGTGKGGTKVCQSLSDFNLCGPSPYALRKCQAGFTLESGIYAPLLRAFYQTVQMERAVTSPLFPSEIVHVVPCCLAADGTALKPGLEYDSTHHVIAGLTHALDVNYIKQHPIPDNDSLRSKMATEADVSFLTTLDNGASMPIGVHYLPKSFNGQQMKELFLESVKCTQICSSCLNQNIREKTVVLDKEAVQDICRSFCGGCWEKKSVCQKCKEIGQKSWMPALRSCDKCVELGIKCVRITVFVVVTDCEEHNKQVMASFGDIRENHPSLRQATMLPDCVHLGKSLKCSWANWFIILENCRTNLVLVRTLRDNGDAKLKTSLRDMLSLECVRNKDRMAVEPILRLTHTPVLDLLSSVEFVIHTIVPETYRYWNSNIPGNYLHPTGICTGPPGILFVVDITDEASGHGRLLEVRLHYPADVKVLKKIELPLSGNLTYLDGVIFITTQTPGKIIFIDYLHKVSLQVSKIRSKREVETELHNRNLSTTGTMSILRERLNQHLKHVSKQYPNKDEVVLDIAIEPTAIFGDSQMLFCFDDIAKSLTEICLVFDGVGIKGEVRHLTKLNDISKMNDLKKVDTKLVCSTEGNTNGIVIYDLGTCVTEIALRRDGITGIGIIGQEIVIGNSISHNVSIVDMSNCNGEEKVVGGNGETGNKDGTTQTSKFTQPFGVCTEAHTIFVTDPSCGRIALISNMIGTCRFLNVLGSFYRAFGIHEKGKKGPDTRLQSAAKGTDDICRFIKDHVTNAKAVQELKSNVTNGPEGTVSSKTQQSLQLLQSGLAILAENIESPSSSFTVDASTLLTSIVENLHAVSHFKHPTFSLLDYARDFSTIIKESVKRISLWSVKYFTHPNSYYPVPKSNSPLTDITAILNLDSDVQKVTKEDEKIMKSWIEAYRPLRQRSVRDETTKDKAGTLPVSLYVKKTQIGGQFCIGKQGMLEADTTNEEDERESTNDRKIDQDQESEYESESDSDETSVADSNKETNSSEGQMFISRSGRTIKAAVKDIHLHPELFSVENNLLTSTFKNKRFELRKFFQKEFDSMYKKHGA